jgi:hypothetical protein
VASAGRHGLLSKAAVVVDVAAVAPGTSSLVWLQARVTTICMSWLTCAPPAAEQAGVAAPIPSRAALVQQQYSLERWWSLYGVTTAATSPSTSPCSCDGSSSSSRLAAVPCGGYLMGTMQHTADTSVQPPPSAARWCCSGHCRVRGRPSPGVEWCLAPCTSSVCWAVCDCVVRHREAMAQQQQPQALLPGPRQAPAAADYAMRRYTVGDI